MPLESTIEIPGLVPPLLTGAITGAAVSEAGGVTPSNIIRTDQTWEVKVDWNLAGSLLSTPFFHFHGDWLVRVYLETMGPGDAHELSMSRVSVDTFTPGGPNKRDYTTTITVSPGASAIPSGIYKMVVALTYESSPGNPGPLAGFFEGGMLQLYKPS